MKMLMGLLEIIVAGAMIFIAVAIISTLINWGVKSWRIDWAKTSERIELIRHQNESKGLL